MKTIQAIILTFLSAAAFAETAWDVDWSQVKMREEAPGFWDNRLVKPKVIPTLKYDRTGRIVGGKETKPHAHPYQAGLLMRIGSGSFLCGGSVIHKLWVLTAAHCPEGTEETQVILGAHRLSDNEDTQQRFIVKNSSYRIHMAYNNRTLNNDICLLLLPTPIKFNAYVKAIALPRNVKHKTFEGERATVR